jgi:hypothetical protein
VIEFALARRFLLGVKRTSRGHAPMSAFDPKRRWHGALDGFTSAAMPTFFIR